MTTSMPSPTGAAEGEDAETPDGPITVHVACDHEIIRKSLAALLDRNDDLQIVEQSPQGIRGVEAALRSNSHVLLLAIPPAEEVAEHVQLYRRAVPATRIVGFCLSRNQADAYRRVDIGEVIYSHSTASELSAAITRAAASVTG